MPTYIMFGEHMVMEVGLHVYGFPTRRNMLDQMNLFLQLKSIAYACVCVYLHAR